MSKPDAWLNKPDVWYEKDSKGHFVVAANKKGREHIDARSDKPNPWTERWPDSDYRCVVIEGEFVVIADFIVSACRAGLKASFKCESCPELHRVDANAVERFSAIVDESADDSPRGTGPLPYLHFKVAPWRPEEGQEPSEEVLEREEEEFQKSPAGNFFGTVSGVYFELKEIQHERELTDAILEFVDALADDLKEAVAHARKHPVGIVLDWKVFSEEAFKALNHGLRHHGLKLSVPDEDTGDQWILTIEKIPEETPQ
jgi:hypothetical protein